MNKRPVDFRALVRAAMAERGLSQSALARAANVPQPNLSDYLAGKSDLNGETLARLFTVLALKINARKKPHPIGRGRGPARCASGET